MGAAWAKWGPVLKRGSFVLEVGADTVAWFAGLTAATAFRYEFDLTKVSISGVLLIGSIATLIQLVVGAAGGLYLGRWRYGSFEEVAALVRATLITTAVVSLINRYPVHHPIPLSASLAGGIGALVVMAGTRYLWRVTLERKLRPSPSAQRVIVLGAGEAGSQLLTTMLRNPRGTYLPVALLDDDPANANLSVRGVPVLGTRDRLAEVAEQRQATALVVAIPTATAKIIREVSAQAEACGLSTMVLPPVSELLGQGVRLSDLRPITEVDLLGRHEVDTNLDEIAGYIAGRRVMVTGAGGSIGLELCRQLIRFAPSELVMLDRDESALHAVQLAIEGRALLDTPNLVVADIRDGDRIDEVFAVHQPEVVFHAAALKHLPLLELHPSEAVKTNVWGTQVLLEAAGRHGVDRFVNISTDKAADPSSVLGYSKRVAERLTAEAARTAPGTFLSVRFGNVLGSRGSVLTTFRSQIDSGGPVTVTHPDVTRYFMTVEEAVQLVIQAGAVGSDGQALVLDMGEPVRIDDVARRLVDQAERAVEVTYTGLRSGEKLHEVLLGSGEEDHRPAHPLIAHVAVPPLPAECLGSIRTGAEAGEVVRDLCRLCGRATLDLSYSLDD